MQKIFTCAIIFLAPLMSIAAEPQIGFNININNRLFQGSIDQQKRSGDHSIAAEEEWRRRCDTKTGTERIDVCRLAFNQNHRGREMEERGQEQGPQGRIPPGLAKNGGRPPGLFRDKTNEASEEKFRRHSKHGNRNY